MPKKVKDINYYAIFKQNGMCWLCVTTKKNWDNGEFLDSISSTMCKQVEDVANGLDWQEIMEGYIEIDISQYKDFKKNFKAHPNWKKNKDFKKLAMFK